MTATASTLSFREITHALGTPLFLLSTDGLILEANPAAAGLTGRETSELRRSYLKELSTAPERLCSLIGRWGRSSQPTPGAVTLLSPSGGVIDCYCRGWVANASPERQSVLLLAEFRRKDREPSEFIKLNRRVEELRRQLAQNRTLEVERERVLAMEQAARREAERSSRLKDEFLAAVSHELRTPVTTVFGSARLINQKWDLIPEESLRHLMDGIEAESLKLVELVENLLLLARLEIRQQVTTADVDPRSLIDRAVQNVAGDSPAREVRVDAPVGLTIRCVDAYVEQMLLNLLGNADKYSPPDEPIDVVVRAGEGEASISVLDRGEGVEADEVEDLFESFYRSTRARDTTPGKGLGLAVCRRLAEVQGGRVWASPRPGGGMEVGFALPCC